MLNKKLAFYLSFIDKYNHVLNVSRFVINFRDFLLTLDLKTKKKRADLELNQNKMMNTSDTSSKNKENVAVVETGKAN
jgi:hypothetical protein